MKQVEHDNDGKLSLPKLFGRYNCAAEIVIPYRIPRQHKSLIDAWLETRYKPSLWNMDFPWLLVMGTSFVGTALVSVLSWLLGVSLIDAMAGGVMALAVMTLFPLFFLILCPMAYPLSVYVNMRLAWGSDWINRLSGPTHIGITDSGFKLCVRGRLFYNYPNLALWSEVFDLELVSDALYKTVSLRFVYQTGFGRAALRLPLSGFQTVDEMTLVLDHFARNVSSDRQGRLLVLMKQMEFAPLINAFKDGRFDIDFFEDDGLVDKLAFGDAITQCAVTLLRTEEE